MRDKITYEWVAEELDERGDIIDPMFGNSLKEVMGYIEPAVNVNFALVREEGNNEDGLQVREYAYIKQGKLPEEFDDGYKVPKRFFKELD